MKHKLILMALVFLTAAGLGAQEPEAAAYIPFSDDSLIPLSISLGFGYLPGIEHRDFSFNPIWKMNLDFIYRYADDIGIGVGLEFYSRSVEKGSDQDYQIRMLNGSVAWLPNYESRKTNLILGFKGGVNILSYESQGDLGSPEPNTYSLGLEPSIGILFPVSRHQFIKVALAYSWMEIPELYHQPESARREHIRHDNLVLSLSYMF